MDIILGEMQTDYNSQEQGTWVKLDKSTGYIVDTDAEFLLASFSSPIVQRQFELAYQKALNQGEALNLEDNAKFVSEMLSNSVVKNWRGSCLKKKENGKTVPLKYSKAACKKLLYERQDIANWVENNAKNLYNYIKENVDESVKK